MNHHPCIRACFAMLVSCSLGALPAGAAAAPSTGDVAQRLAVALGLDAGRLSDVRVDVETLLDGRRLETVKAIDDATGDAVGATLEGARPVDRYAEIRRAGATWRERHGAITPKLARHLETLSPGESTRVAVWLAVDLAPLGEEKVSFRRRGSEHASGTALGLPADPNAILPPRAAPPVQEFAKPADVERPFVDAARDQERIEQQAALAAADQARLAAVRDLIAPVRESFLARLMLLDLEVSYVSEISPMAVIDARREVLEELASWSQIDALDDASGVGGPSLAFARPTQNVTPINNVGYDGSGVAVSVTEGERAYFANPFLTLTSCYDCGQPFAAHPTAVSGMIRSTHGTEHGLAADVTLHSGNGSYSSFAVMSAAMDWGATNAAVLNNSWYWDSPNSPTFWEVDRHQDYFVRTFFDTVVVAAGNFGNGCGGAFSTYVVSPAKGHNILAVGNYDDLDSVGWAGDVMDGCSSFGNPLDSSGSGSQEKPEIAGVGAGIWSTTTADPWVGPVGSGTSYASPMVTSMAANIMEVDPGFGPNPEAVKGVLMATALHNIEGATRLSDKDGAGGIVGAAAAVSAERGNWAEQSIGSTTTFPIVYTQFAYAGERVRFAIAWSSNPNAAYTTDPLPADIDLWAYREDGTTVVGTSTSVYNAYEIVDFVAPASETYTFKAELWSANWASGGTWLGAGWWRGEYRISPEVGYLDLSPPEPTGNHLVVYPADWGASNYWRAMGIRPLGTSDHDLELASHSLFEDPGLRIVEAGSYYGGSAIDFIVVDGNHRTTTPEHYRELMFSGTDGFNTNFSDMAIGAGPSPSPVTLGPIALGAAQVLSVVDVYVEAGSHRRVRVVPTAGSSDLVLFGFRSDGATASTWTKSKGQFDLYRDRSSSGTATERGGLVNPTGSADWLAVVVENRGAADVTFEIIVLPSSLFSDDFESGDTLEWSSAVP